LFAVDDSSVKWLTDYESSSFYSRKIDSVNRSESNDIPLGDTLLGTELDVRNVDPDTGVGELWIGNIFGMC
jgi:hypothetical protein